MFVDSYTLKWKLTDGSETWWEEFEEVSLSDFETIYGNNIHQILEVSLKLTVSVEMEEL